MITSDIHTLAEADVAPLRSFFAHMPDADRTFFREDVAAPDVIESWVSGAASPRNVEVAVDDGRVVGYVTVIPHIGWSSHVADLRLVVDPDRRRQGLGRQLARRGLLTGLNMGLKKIVVEVAAQQEPAIALFRGLGFEAEALLKDQMRAQDGTFRDVLLLSHFVDDTWGTMQTTGVEDLLG